jgi:hypothetical protein
MPDYLTGKIRFKHISERSGSARLFFCSFLQYGRLPFIIAGSAAIGLALKKIVMEKLTTIVKGTMAYLVHVCNGKVIYRIQTENHLYQLEVDSTQKEWETTYLEPSFKSITLMRWIRKGMENNDGTFIKLK